jgi:putative PIN family toxin of toxin-antitoxin system
MRIVLDSNVLISALGTHGLCETVMLACLEHHEVIVSEYILKEVCAGLTGKFKVPAEQAQKVGEFLRKHCRIVCPGEIPKGACRDTGDLNVLGTAVAGNAHCLVTGDRDLLVLGEYGDIPIQSPRAFCETLGKST